MQLNGSFKKVLLAATAVSTLALAPVLTAQPAAAFGHGGYGGGFGGHRIWPGGGGWHGGYGGGWRGGYGGGGWRRGGYGYGYGLAGFGLGLGLGAAYGGYGYPYGYGGGYGYEGAGYGGYGYGGYGYGGGCLRRVYGYYGPHLVRVC